MMHLRCYCTFSNSCPNLQQQQQGHLVSPRRRQLDVNKRHTTIYKGARRPATADVPKLSTTEHFHDTQPLILMITYSSLLLFGHLFSATVVSLVQTQLEVPSSGMCNVMARARFISHITTYRGERTLAIESHLQQGCRVVLSGSNLLRIHEMQWAISESFSCKSNVTRCAVMVQIDQIATYLSTNAYANKSSTTEEISTATHNIHPDLHALNIFPNSENSLVNQIKLYANKQLAMCWTTNIQNNEIDYILSNDGAGDIEELIGFHENERPAMYTY
ncbi:hypothetical protein AGLY_016569 [Aphis glycines]|uniref:Uncharacterized protein n=1 Tax=Aphis glycines TaxID=307491 RepID=A0A6G0SXQ9_APHGL|nr:hypothetical protein AGLY_016569 [Aphis glycines]